MVHKVVGEEGEHAQGREHRHGGAAVLCIALKCLSTRGGDVTFSPVREKCNPRIGCAYPPEAHFRSL